MNKTLSSLLLDLSNLSDEEAEEKTFQEYIRLYMDRETHKGKIGVRKTHDGEDVIFYEDRFTHAFYTSLEGLYSQFKKDKFDKERAVRIRWIGKNNTRKY